MWKARGKLVYSAEYDQSTKTVKVRDWREKNDKHKRRTS